MELASWKSQRKCGVILKAGFTESIDFGLQSKSWNLTKEISNSKEGQGLVRLEIAYDWGILADAGLDTTAAVLQVSILGALKEPKFLNEGKGRLETKRLHMR